MSKRMVIKIMNSEYLNYSLKEPSNTSKIDNQQSLVNLTEDDIFEIEVFKIEEQMKRVKGTENKQALLNGIKEKTEDSKI
jgi:hypothetical protein